MRNLEDDGSGTSPFGGVYDRLRSRYFFKIGAAILVLSIILLGVGYITLTTVQASVESDSTETLLTAAEREADGIEEFIVDRNADAVRISESEALAEGDTERIRGELQTNLDILPNSVRSIHYYDMETGTITVSSHPVQDGQEVRGDRPWAVDGSAFDGPGDVRSFEPYETNGEKRMGFVSPVVGQEDHAVVVTVDLTKQGRLLTPPVDGAKIDVVSTRTGEVALASDSDAILEDYFLLEELPHLQENVRESRTDAARIDHELVDDDQVVVTTVPIQQKPWAVTVVAPESEVFGTVGDVSRSILVLIAVSIVGFGVVGVLISRDINESLGTMTGYAEEIEEGNLEVSIDRSRTDEFGQLAALFARIRDTLKEQLDEVEQRAAEAEAERERAREAKAAAEEAQADAQRAKAEAEALSEHLEEKATAYSETIDAAADGDLTRRLDTESESRAMTEIGESLNRMLEDLEGMVVRIQTVAQRVDEKSSEVTASTEEVRASSAEVAESIEEISAGAERQNEKLTTAASEMSDLSATVEEIASSSANVAGQSEQAATVGREGQRTARGARESMAAIESKTEDTVGEMETLQAEVERIEEVVALIDDIADQTNLLAINASIEAAAATDGGDGFAVVADEVKSLAEETAEATDEVERLIEAVEDSTSSVAEDMFEMQSEVEHGRETIDETVSALEEMVEQVADANAGIQSINEATDDQAASAQEVTTMVDDVTSVSDRTAKEAANVSAAAEEQTSAVERIATGSESLSGRADELRTLVSRFETDGNSDEASNDDVDAADVDSIVSDD
ncbi:chemotaxis protein [Halobiforma lacisalsi AJ5]|uniref:Chemotaxis protein n=1 Tax=Natronobacterium lacisalsi AJ5 TaxID=358396 RepID=M0LKK0_NATLA|nr:HAMP domain-containing methyl-accepting chemotaxis protein [Halobiforma lacisalsi]APW98651.1 chemotaxis protein [Halobiforma lacisalsi AJ5]EMA32520.1 methyl-accepting chemotaxis sensory transducer [Halobiforma lacisalsi AJ5]